MNGDDLLWDFCEGVLLNAPTFIVLAVGAIIALTHWERNPAVALFGTLGFVWLGLGYVAAIAWNRVLVPDLFPNPGSTAERLSYVVLSGLEAIGFVFLMIAMCVYRRRPRHPHYYDEHDGDQRHLRLQSVSYSRALNEYMNVPT